ncbi:MAG: iron export ABC transporter permease subunit FetB [Nostocales cyanobacterium]|nr:MAG: iron export ABC transporter permease subunit FetB [Nostocales cyanobacterium]TAF15614.1 MAG: iron export ABC transporter permease subunit FetB [Nostocales cyanobacterium]
MADLVKLDSVDLVLTVALMAIAIGLSIWENLGIALNLAIATFRTILQLIVLGYVLEFIFAIDNIWAVLSILTIMLTISAIVTRNRISQKIPLLLPIIWVSIFISTSLILVYTNVLIIQPERWYEPRYLIPLGSILIANGMNAATIAAQKLVSSINQFPTEIETHLSLGATPEQAIKKYRQEAVKAAFMPTLNQMMLIGMVTIPTFTSGQLLAGVPTLDAVSYNILVMFMVAVVNLITTIFLTKTLYRQFFNHAMQLVK